MKTAFLARLASRLAYSCCTFVIKRCSGRLRVTKQGETILRSKVVAVKVENLFDGDATNNEVVMEVKDEEILHQPNSTWSK